MEKNQEQEELLLEARLRSEPLLPGQTELTNMQIMRLKLEFKLENDIFKKTWDI
jgi:hypothetical protein